jgi:hypothetical protein
MATGSLNNNPYMQQVLFQNLSSTNIQPGQVKNSAQLISSAYSAKSSIATISANGAKINNASNTIRASGDMQAFEGFQNAVSRAGASSDPLPLIRFSNGADFAAKNDAEGLNNAFSALARNLDSNSNALTDGFNAAFSSTVEQNGVEGLRVFNQGMKGIEQADYSSSQVRQSQNMQKYFSLVSQINSEAENSQQAMSDLSRLSRGVELGTTADSIWDFFNEFVGPDNVI